METTGPGGNRNGQVKKPQGWYRPVSVVLFVGHLSSSGSDKRLSLGDHRTTTTEEGTMKYLCLVYFEEKKLDAIPKSEFDALAAECLAYDEELRKSGHCIASDRHDRAGPERQAVRHRRSLRRDEGAAGRVLPHQREGLGRGHSIGLQEPAGPSRQHRGAADQGV